MLHANFNTEISYCMNGRYVQMTVTHSIDGPI